MKNKLGDLNNHLFAALERLSDEDMSAVAASRIASRDGVTRPLATSSCME